MISKKPTKMKYRIALKGLLCCLFILSCNKPSKSESETTIGDYKVPETIPLTFTEPEPFEWETITSDTLTTPVTYSLDVDALPTKPFELNTFKPLKSPMKEYALEWDKLPEESIKYDSIPFTITTAPIKKPTITKMKPPGMMAGTNANLLQLSADEGLISNDITSFVETEDGAIWIGTSGSAVMRYDGENTFAYDYNGVYKMTLDKQGKLWMMRPGPDEITVLDFKNNIAYSILTDEDFVPLNVLCDHRGTLYISSGNGPLFTMDPEMVNLQQLTIEGRNGAWSLMEDSNDNLWIGYRDGLAVLDKERETLKTISPHTDYELNSIVVDIKEDELGAIWLSLGGLGTTQGLFVLQLSLKDETVRILGEDNGLNWAGSGLILFDEQGNLWVMGTSEVYIINKNRSAYKTIGLNSALQGRLRLTRPFNRKDGSIWIATTDKGAIIANDFTLTTEYFDTYRGLINDQVWEIEEDSRGEIWLGTIDGINIIDPKKNTIKALNHDVLHSTLKNVIQNIEEIRNDIFFINAVSGFSILDRMKNKLTVYASNRNSPLRIWDVELMNDHTFLMTTEEGIFVYDIKTNVLKKITSKTTPGIFKKRNQSVIYYDKKEILWFPTNDGLAKINLKAQTVSYLNEEQGLCDNSTFVVSLSKEGELWLATLNGIAILNLEENTLTNVKEENGLIPAEMYDLIELDNLMYAASVDGLIPMERKTAKTTNKGYYTFNGGLGFKSTDYLENSPKFLRNGQFWSGVGSPTNEFRLLVLDAAPKPDGDSLRSTVFIKDIFVMDEEPGFSSKNGVDSLNTEVATSYAKAKKMKWDSITYPYGLAEGLELPFDQNSLSFSYGSGDVFNRGQLTYRFILDGADEDWTYAAKDTKTKNYYNLKPGDYTFKVAARGFNNKWSTPATLAFKISPPWWQTWWAYLLFAITFGGAVWSFVSYRSRWLKKENRVLEERVTHRTSQLKTKIDELKATQSQLIQSEKMASLGELTAGIAHEIQNPLNFVNNFSEVNTELIDEMEEELKKGDYEEVLALSKDIKDNQQKINHHGRRADAIVKGMLQHSRSSNNEKEPSNINAIADEYLRLAYHGLRAKDKSFNATLNTDFDESIGKINIVAQDVGRVILNLITNAFHAVIEKNEQQKGKENNSFKPTVWVATKREGDTVRVTIRDNGNGVPDKVRDKIFQPFFTTKPSGQGTGLGLSLSYDIIKTHGGTLVLDTTKGEGTTFTITLPGV